jgi:thiol-disulfide isomerase/thioredoxin
MNLPRFFTLLLAAAALAAFTHAQEVPRPAPAWTLKDLDGNAVSSEQFKGRVVVVDFWATWCGPCVAEIPGYVELQKKYGKDGLAIIGISLDRVSPAKVKAFAEKHGMNYTVVIGGQDTTDAFGGFEAIPTTFLIDRQGRIVHQKTGGWNHAEYEALVKRFL